VIHDGKENTYSFDFNGKQVVSKPLSVESMQENRAKRSKKLELIVTEIETDIGKSCVQMKVRGREILLENDRN
jgi:hypothetical protein